jgi:hypothetical protein
MINALGMFKVVMAALLGRATASMKWDLEDYNGWNLPFAKTVQI